MSAREFCSYCKMIFRLEKLNILRTIVQKTTLRIRPHPQGHTYPDVFEKGDFSLRFCLSSKP